MVKRGIGYIIHDLDVILCENLVDENNNFYNLTLGMALSEEIGDEPFLYYKYSIVDGVLKWFKGWTETKVVFNLTGIGIEDTLLASMDRNPNDIS